MSYALDEGGERSVPEAVLSPRRALSLSRERASVSILGRDLQENLQYEEAQQRRQGAKPAEVYGFVGAICTTVATAIFFVWAYSPEIWLHSVGITYYPSRYWALAIPSYVMGAAITVLCVYVSLNHIATPPPQSFNTMFDMHTREPICNPVIRENAGKPILPISDIPILEVNNLLYGRATPNRRGLSNSDN